MIKVWSIAYSINNMKRLCIDHKKMDEKWRQNVELKVFRNKTNPLYTVFFRVKGTDKEELSKDEELRVESKDKEE